MLDDLEAEITEHLTSGAKIDRVDMHEEDRERKKREAGDRKSVV